MAPFSVPKFMDTLYWAQADVRGAIKRTSEAWSIRGHPLHLVGGIPTVDLLADDRVVDRTEQLTRALALIRDYYPLAYKRLVNDIRRILIDDVIPVQAMYFIGTRSCTLHPTLFGGTDATVATAIVHEGVHARIDVRRVMQTGARRERAERICRRAERYFVSRFPRTPSLDQWFLRHMDGV